MSLTLLNPFRELKQFENSFFNEFNENGFFKPATDLFETDKEFIVKVDLPGFAKDDISVNASNNIVEIKAEIIKEKSDESDDSKASKEGETVSKWVPRHVERVSRNFYRKIKFHKPIDANNAELNLENGVLTIKLPISKEAQKISLTID